MKIYSKIFKNLQISMDWAVVVVLLILFQPSLSVLFTVEAEQTKYISEYGGNVVMGCRFDPPSNPQNDLKVTWLWTSVSRHQEVIQINNTVEQSTSPRYQGRVKMLLNELKDGWAKLQMSDLKIDDSGTYQCLVKTAEGTDYKTITLSVAAPYKSISKWTQKTEGEGKVLLTCESEGYPESPVAWLDGRLRQHNPNTTATRTTEGLFKIISQIEVSSSEKNNYTCNFTRDGHSATILIPDDIPTPCRKSDAGIIVLSISLVLTVVGVGVLVYRRRKGCRGARSRKCLTNDTDLSAVKCLQTNKENGDEEIDMIEGHTEENLGLYLKGRYSEFSLSAETRRHSEGFTDDELLQKLQNNDGQPARFQDLLPEVGEVLLLEGLPGSGKTAVAQMLVSSWTKGPKHGISNFLDLSFLDVLLYVNCSSVKGDLFEEMTVQLSLSEKKSAEELRTVLSCSSKALLLLDGYKEGNHFFDETLRSFLNERGSCRVLVTSCLGDCPTLKQTLGPEALLKLQIQPAKY